MASNTPVNPKSNGYIVVSQEWCSAANALPRLASRAAFAILSLPYAQHKDGWRGSTRQFSRATQISQNGRLLPALVVVEAAGLIKMCRRRGYNGLSIRVVDPWFKSKNETNNLNSETNSLDNETNSPNNGAVVSNQDAFCPQARHTPVDFETGPILAEKQDPRVSIIRRESLENETLESNTKYTEYPEYTNSPDHFAESESVEKKEAGLDTLAESEGVIERKDESDPVGKRNDVLERGHREDLIAESEAVDEREAHEIEARPRLYPTAESESVVYESPEQLLALQRKLEANREKLFGGVQ